MVKYVTLSEMKHIDEELFTKYKYSVEQLMELSGLSCAMAIAKSYPVKDFGYKQILVICGPGNNGGDGLVCARHLKFFGYRPVIYYHKKKPSKPIYCKLMYQCELICVPVLDSLPRKRELACNYKLIVDALFGFGFKPPVKREFCAPVTLMKNAEIPIVSIDVPTGWSVDGGKSEEPLEPQMLVSVAVPKLCSKEFSGQYHYLGGRFVPSKLAEKFKLNLPTFPGIELCVLLPKEKDDKKDQDCRYDYD